MDFGFWISVQTALGEVYHIRQTFCIETSDDPDGRATDQTEYKKAETVEQAKAHLVRERKHPRSPPR